MNPFYEKRKGKIDIHHTENLSFPAHLHEHTEILYVLNGSISLKIGNINYILKCGDCGIIFPGEVHQITTEQYSSLLILIFDPELTGEFRYSFQKYRPSHPCFSKTELPGDVRLAFKRLEQFSKPEHFILRSAWIQVLLAMLFPGLMLKEKKDFENEPLAYQAIRYLTVHFREDISLESLASALHVNKYYLSHTFSEKLGVSFPGYLNQLRLEQAVLFMRSTDKPLEYIWEESGFTSQRSFNRIFRQYYGTTPSRFRKNSGNTP